MEKCQKGNSLAAYSTSRTVLNGLRHEVARVAVMTYLLRTSPDVLPSVPYQDLRPGSSGGMQLLGQCRLTNKVVRHS